MTVSKCKNGKMEKAQRLLAVLKDKRTLLIVMQDFPDPDAIGAAAALRELARSQGDVTTTLTCGGFVSRAENRALLKYLGLNVQPMLNTPPANYDCIALVDTQPGAGNNALAPLVVPDIVVDHHPIRPLTRKATFFDVRKRYGATSSIFQEYMQCANVPIPVPLATALLYGIRSDTADFGREATQSDINAFLALYPSSNKRMLGRIAMARVPRAYFRTIAAALAHAQSAGDCVFTNLGAVDNPDIVSEVADLLLRDEETNWALALGLHRDELLISVRSSDVSADAGKLMHHLVGNLGTGGGHTAMAGGQIKVDASDTALVGKLADTVIRRFLKKLRARRSDLHMLLEGRG
jgi:nanoRNase/pAp phosphatase (c-di-AMP/oligoRNAs hydrolase)